MSQTAQGSFHIEISADSFYSESNIHYLKKVIDGIEDGTRPLTEHDLIDVDEE